MGFIHDDQVPACLPQSRQNIQSPREIQGGDYLTVFLPRIHGILRPQVWPAQQMELLTEFVVDRQATNGGGRWMSGMPTSKGVLAQA